MNTRLIIFSSVVTSILGAGLGLVLASVAPTQYTGEMYQHLDHKYAVIGAVAGLLFGASQESIRQLKKQRDQEEALTKHVDQFH